MAQFHRVRQPAVRYLQPHAHYLVEVDEVPIYYLRQARDAQPDQFTSTYFIGYHTKQGQYLTGNAGYVAAIKAGYFRVVAYDGQVTPGLDDVLASTLRADPDYRLAASIPVSGGAVTYYVWVHEPGKVPTRPASPSRGNDPTAGPRPQRSSAPLATPSPAAS